MRQIRRAQEQVLQKFQRMHGKQGKLETGVIVYCPDHRVADLNAVGLDAERVVDASQADQLVERIQHLLSGRSEIRSAQGRRVHEFFRHTFEIVPDIHAHIGYHQETFTRLSGGLAEVLDRIEMSPLRLRLKGAAGSGKSQVAGHFYRQALAEGRKPMLVCFNRPLANQLSQRLPEGGRVSTWHQLLADFLEAQGDRPDFQQVNRDPEFWDKLMERVLEFEVAPEWQFDPVIVDEGQDFKEEWFEGLQLFAAGDADMLWMEDPDQNVRANREVGLPGFVGYRSPENYRTPDSIARFIQNSLDFDFTAANPLPGLGVRVSAFTDAADQQKRLAHRLQELVRMGFAKDEIVILTVRGMGSCPLWPVDTLGSFRLSRFTGEYDAEDRQVMSEGDIRLETVGRFKGQQAPAAILTDVDPRADRLTEDLERIYTGMTRATVRLEMLVAEANPENQRFMEAS
ncbi:hypothetical protein AN478_06965 [Thiohalorhabdus denitrificans]|uniref:ATP-binding domain-containing protein n=1 Tax=Thiohalorhabdus denitrificans TaxID=381306 RepID=UPI0006D53861|nr:ATP-binding domain-containing protein [Thiohalorhabdus denitrificans]KPV39931.1 hypothetical protein AN478_06965 [Thiohalorhabdus denitrificans]